MKNFLLTILICAISIICPALDVAASPTMIDGIYYELCPEDSHATVTFGDNSYDGRYTIPATVTHNGKTYTVTEIGERAFYDNRNITAVHLPETIVSIGDNAFGWCLNLRELNFPAALRKIGKASFAYVAIPELIVPEGITEIPQKAFMGLEAKRIVLPSNLKTIGEDGLKGCSKIKELILPETLEDVYSGGLTDLSQLQSIHIPSRTYFHKDQYDETVYFGGLTYLTEITVDPANPYYSSYNGVMFNKDLSQVLEFPNYYRHSSFEFPDKCTSFHKNCGGNETVEHLTLPNVRGEAMSSAPFTALKSIHFGAGAEIVAKYDNSSLYSPNILMSKTLEKIEVDPANEEMTVKDGVLYNKNCRRLYRYPANLPGASFVLPESVEIIGIESMAGLNNLRELIIDHPGVTAEPYAIGSTSFQKLKLYGLSSSNKGLSFGVELFEPYEQIKEIYITDKLSFAHEPTMYVGNGVEINIIGTSVPECKSDASIAYNSNWYPDVKIYVHVGLKEKFEEAPGWRQFAGRIYEKDFSDVVRPECNSNIRITTRSGCIYVDDISDGAPVEIFDISGRNISHNADKGVRETHCRPGCYIVRAGNIIKRVYVR